MTEQYNFLEAVQKYIVKALQYVFALTGNTHIILEIAEMGLLILYGG